MSKVVKWFLYRELLWFHWINQRIRHKILDLLLGKITHLGGATATITSSFLVMILSTGNLRIASIQGLIALTISHIPVAWLKKKYRRMRPYQVLSMTNLLLHPLKDHSFPSGHTTAIFAIVIPYIVYQPSLAYFLLPLAFIVAYSRIYNGLHFPTDCLVGMILGTLTATCVVAFWV